MVPAVEIAGRCRRFVLKVPAQDSKIKSKLTVEELLRLERRHEKMLGDGGNAHGRFSLPQR